VRNTFLDSLPSRSPSLERLLGERKVHSTPVSGQLEFAERLPMDAEEPFFMRQLSPWAPCAAFGDVEKQDAAQIDGAGSDGPDPEEEEEFLAKQPSATPNESSAEAPAEGNPDGDSISVSVKSSPPLLPQQMPIWGEASTAGSTHSPPSEATTVELEQPASGPPAAASEPLPPAAGAPDLRTQGSALHQKGKCKPCAFAFREEGCRNGADCPFCHMCTKGDKQRRKQEQIALKAARKAQGQNWNALWLQQQQQQAWAAGAVGWWPQGHVQTGAWW